MPQHRMRPDQSQQLRAIPLRQIEIQDDNIRQLSILKFPRPHQILKNLISVLQYFEFAIRLFSRKCFPYQVRIRSIIFGN